MNLHHRRRGHNVTYDRIRIRKRSNYWKGYALNYPPMSYDSWVHILTIYGQGVRNCNEKGMDIEFYCEYFLNHEFLHDIILNTYGKFDYLRDARLDDPNVGHWPFYCGIDFLESKDMWFALGIFRILQEYHFHLSPSQIRDKLLL